MMAAKKSAFDVTTMHKGLGNNAGENNCFLNVTIQALWHLGPFRYVVMLYYHEKKKAVNI